ncbi:GDSL-type esterase/lipase family protein [Geothrix sp. PMB-07]|uniref:GDSL-type esterase/lipase family protein n=1 Tax=Geothrix sp. PMB-07 TaxID=3068640 RepID=UPI002741EB99|nr:GDSL-type esterase/lipase family protein [Geothrix sp. PMB-07]WLT33438.1 GDSL-type esterase/lipase family protein [Geothrix sp. PMB-07]
MRWGLWALLATLGLLPLSAQVFPSEPTPELQGQARARLEAWRASRLASLCNDWGELNRYRSENRLLPPPKAGEARVVFLGDSITEAWPLQKSFPGRPFVNRGISGQTTAQLLLRFRPDVIDLKPQVVFILAGTNDIAGNTGPVTEAEILGNLASMGELAQAHGVRPVFCSVLPVHRATPTSLDFWATRPMSRIRALNQGLQQLCKSKGYTYLDAFTPMLDEAGQLRPDLADDGLHPNEAGYRQLGTLVTAALRGLLGGG